MLGVQIDDHYHKCFDSGIKLGRPFVTRDGSITAKVNFLLSLQSCDHYQTFGTDRDGTNTSINGHIIARNLIGRMRKKRECLLKQIRNRYEYKTHQINTSSTASERSPSCSIFMH